MCVNKGGKDLFLSGSTHQGRAIPSFEFTFCAVKWQTTWGATNAYPSEPGRRLLGAWRE